MMRKFIWVFPLAAFASAEVGAQYTETTGTVGEATGTETIGGYTATASDYPTIGGIDYGDIFEDYLDDEMRDVDMDQDVAIKACVSNSEALVKKIDGSYNKCFKDFEDLNEFQENNVGNDEDKDGLTDKYEEKEACFYRDLGWVDNDKANKEAIKKDFENLNSKSIKYEFITSIEACADWNGMFRERKKRDAEEETWALSLARERREAHNGNGKGNGKVTKRRKGSGKNGNGKVTKRRKGRGKNGNGKGKGKVTKRRKGRGKNGKRNGKVTKRRKGRKGNGKGKENGKVTKRRKAKGRNGNVTKRRKGNGKVTKRRKGNGKGTKTRRGRGKRKNGNDNGKGKRNKKKGNGGKGKGDNNNDNGLTKAEQKTIKQLLPDNVYNQLWCYELSLEKALEHCVVRKLRY